LEDEFLCLTVVSQPDEGESDFASRLSVFWTHLLRSAPDVFEQVYAETIEFETKGDRVTRQYLCEEPAVPAVLSAMADQGIVYEEVDVDDRWSKYEAAPTEWWQIEH
jgi:hypothetical protein